MRFAVEDHLAAKLAVQLGDRAGAIDQPVAALDHDVGIGADQRQLAVESLQQHGAIIFGGFGFVVEQAGADDVVGLFQRCHDGVEPAVDRRVPLRTDPEDLLAGMVGDEIPGQVA